MRFRVYDRVDKKFHYPSQAGRRYLIDSCGNFITPSAQFGDSNQIIQFSTGVFDKNGVEIYDGDMVEYKLGEKIALDLVSYDKENLMLIMSGTGDNSGIVLQFVKYLDYIVVGQSVP